MIKQQGFTLVEIMVAVSIVAILATIAIITYSSVLNSTRNQQRARDLFSIQQALELFRHDKYTYPLSPVALGNLSPNYLPSLPVDPVSGKPYQYAPGDDCTYTRTSQTCVSYILCAAREGGADSGMPSGCQNLMCDGTTTGSCGMGVSSP